MGTRVVILGRGNVATSLCNGLQDTDAEVVQMWHRGEAVCNDADIYIVCVKDDAVGDVGRLCPSCAFVVHTAGSIEMNVLEQEHRGVLYPMQSFTKGRQTEWGRVPFFLETHLQEDYERLLSFANLLSPTCYPLSSQRRKTLHMAAVWASNFANHLWTITSDILHRENIPFSVMLPLIDETVSKLSVMTPREAQTGPARRGDMSVIKAHEEMLPDLLKEIYLLLSDSIYHDTLRPEKDTSHLF